MRRKSNFIYIISITFALANSAIAQTYSYPELNVVPRASDRLEMESKWERTHRNKVHLGVQASALTTLIAGLTADVDTRDDEDEISSKLAVGVGLGWLAISYAMSRKYYPYTYGAKDLKKIKGNSTRDQLTRERMAEEVINNAAATGKRMKWISFTTNLLANSYLSTTSKSKSTGSYVAALGVLMSFTPFIFNYHWEDVATEQDKYKKKIYAPVASTGLLFNPFENKAIPGMTLSMQF